MKIKKPKTGIVYVGKIPDWGMTIYIKNGQPVARNSSSCCKSNTYRQFIQRQRMRHSIALWQELKLCAPMFTQGSTAYNNFISLANRLPVVYLPKESSTRNSVLMPGIPVSDGILNPIQEWLGEVNGVPALLTDRKTIFAHNPELYLLYTAELGSWGADKGPIVKFKVREVRKEEFTEVDGCLALVSEEFADEKKGWALVRVIMKNCTTQTIVTHCKEYEKYTTEEAYQIAAKSYGGVK